MFSDKKTKPLSNITDKSYWTFFGRNSNVSLHSQKEEVASFLGGLPTALILCGFPRLPPKQLVRVWEQWGVEVSLYNLISVATPLPAKAHGLHSSIRIQSRDQTSLWPPGGRSHSHAGGGTVGTGGQNQTRDPTDINAQPFPWKGLLLISH